MTARVGGAGGRWTADGRYVARRLLPGPAGTARFMGKHARAGFPVVLEAPADAAAFERATAVLRGLRRDGHVRLLDLTQLDDAPCLVLEYVEGASLAEILTGQRRLSPLRACRLGLDVAAALAECHALGRVHGDLRPEQVLVSLFPSGDERAKVRGHGARPPRGSVYRAPELDGTPTAEATEASDVYAFGMLLHVATSGVAPLERHEGLPALGELVPVPGRFADLVAWSTRTDPRGRPESALELLAALRALDLEELARFDLGPATPRSHPATSAPRSLEEHTDTVSLLTGSTPSVWVLADELPRRSPEVASAIAELDGRHQVVAVPYEDRGRWAEAIVDGRTDPPWVVLFDDMTVLLEDPLLAALCDHGETSKMLVSTHANFDLAHHAVNACGIDQHVSLPAEARTLAFAVERLVRRSLGIRRHYDGLRLALRDAQEDLDALEREAAGSPDAIALRSSR